MASVQYPYDAVILGAGLNGLMTGSLLAKNGLRTLILEENPQLGGAHSVKYFDGFPFTNSPVLLQGLEKNGYCDHLFSELGLSLSLLKRQKRLLMRPSPILQVVTGEHRVNLETNRENQLPEWKREWGVALSSIQGFYQELDEADQLLYPFFFQRKLESGSLPLGERVAVLHRALQRTGLIRRNFKMSARKGLLRYDFPPDLLQMFEALSLLWFGTDLDKTSFLQFQLQQIFLSREIIRPVGSLLKICEELAKVVVQNRGKILYRQSIQSITRERRKGWVIETNEKEPLRTRFLIVNHTPEQVSPQECGRLTFYFTLDPKAVPLPMGEQVLLQRPADSPFGAGYLLSLTLSLPDEEKGLIETKRLLSVQVLKPCFLGPDDEKQRDMLHEVLKGLHWLMPFSEGKIQYRGNNATASKEPAKRFQAITPLLAHLKWVKRPHYAYAYYPLDKRCYFLPDQFVSPAMLMSELSAGDEVVKKIIKKHQKN